MHKTKTKQSISKAERLLLANQYEILQKLNNDDSFLSKRYRKLQAIFQAGAECFYDEAFTDIADTLDEDFCQEVIQIFELRRAIRFSLKKSGISQEKMDEVATIGFDGNNECAHFSFARLLQQELNRFQEMSVENSHMPSLHCHRRMLDTWNSLDNRNHLSETEIEALLKNLPTMY